MAKNRNFLKKKNCYINIIYNEKNQSLSLIQAKYQSKQQIRRLCIQPSIYRNIYNFERKSIKPKSSECVRGASL